MPAVPGGYSSNGQVRQQTCFDRVKIGFTMGFTVGMVMGIVFGGFAGLRYTIRLLNIPRSGNTIVNSVDFFLDKDIEVVNSFRLLANLLSRLVVPLARLWLLAVLFDANHPKETLSVFS
jgi:hypothetical protein